MASASVGSLNWLCQSLMGSWLVTTTLPRLASHPTNPSAPLPFRAHVDPSNPAFLKPLTPGC